MITDTIVAQCTPVGKGALALMRVSGPLALTVVDQCARLSSGQNVNQVASHTIHHGWLTAADNTVLDEVLFLVMHAPKTFTGHHVVEITTHNNQFMIESIIERIIACGARLAGPGEFTRQAVENGKIDLLQAEAINELIHANSQHALASSLSQLQGTLSQNMSQLETDLLRLTAFCEATFEFIEEPLDFSGQINESLDVIIAKVSHLKQSFGQHEQLRQGIRIAFVGTVNAGKSSLFNALLGKKRAIVTPIAGTTRDALEAGLYKEGIYWTVIDTAGIRQTTDVIEQEGVERSYAQAQIADIVLLIHDASRTLTDEEELVYQKITAQHQSKLVTVFNKIDQVTGSFTMPGICTSATTGQGITELETAIKAKIKETMTTHSSPFLLNKRHFTLLVSLEQKLNGIKAMLVGSIEYELVAHHLKDALETVTELTGKTINEKMLDTVFKEFCVGK